MTPLVGACRGRRPSCSAWLLGREPGEDTGGDHRGDEQQPDDDVDDVDGVALQAHGAREHAQQDHAGDHAVQGAAATEDGDAAEQDCRDHLELEPGGVVAAGAAVAQRVVDAGQRRHGAGEHEEDELRASHVDAGEVRGLVVEPDLEDALPNDEEVQQQHEEHQQDEERDDDHGVAGLADALLGEVGPLLREVGDRGGAEQPDREPAVERERPDRHRQRRQPDVGDEEAVEGPRHGPGEDRQQGGHRDGEPEVLVQDPDEDAAQPDHAGHREVDLAGDDHQRHRQRDQQDRSDVEQQVVDGRAVEVEHVGAGVGEDRHEQADDGRLAGEQHPLPQRTGVRRVRAGLGALGSGRGGGGHSSSLASMSLRACRSDRTRSSTTADDEGADDRSLPEVGDAEDGERPVDGHEEHRADRGTPDRAAAPKIATPPITAAPTAWSSIPSPAPELTVP